LFGCYFVGEIFATVFYLLVKFQPAHWPAPSLFLRIVLSFNSHVKSGLILWDLK